MNSASTIHQIAANSISVTKNGEIIGYWIPSQSISESASEDDNLFLEFVNPERVPVIYACITLLPGQNCRIEISPLELQSWTDLCRIAIIDLQKWISLHLDRTSMDISAEGFIEGDWRTTEDYWVSEPADETILTAGPLIGPREATLVLDAVMHGWNRRHSEYLAKFEADFASYIGVKSALATSSCTGALHLALLALGIGPGDEVIVPETTWVATGAAVAYVGAIPVFADVDPLTWTITPESVQAVMSERTRAILPVHLYGFPADMPSLMAFANKHDLLVLEDAAPAIGALVDGKAVGSFGHMGAFSFQGAKMLVTGEGGMLVTNDQVLRDKAWKQQDHGRKPGTFWIDEIGRKYKMSNVTAALGLAQLQSVETQIAKKRRINEWYRQFLADTPGVSFQTEIPSSRSICWMTSISLEEGLPDRDYIATQLLEQGIDTRPVFPPISTYPIWSQSQGKPGANAAWVGSRGLNLPSGVGLSRASVTRVAEAIHSAVQSA